MVAAVLAGMVAVMLHSLTFRTVKMLQLSTIPIYVINLARCVERKKKMIARLQKHGLLNQTHFVVAHDRDGPLLDSVVIPHTTRAEIACLLSHHKAIEMFLACGDEYALMLEDDVMFHRDLEVLWRQHIDKLPHVNPTVVMLCTYMIGRSDPPDLNSHYTTINCSCYGAQSYIISKAYAREVIERYSHLLRGTPSEVRLTSENILIESRGVRTKQYLFVEEALDTNIQNEISVRWHHDYFSRVGYSCYD